MSTLHRFKMPRGATRKQIAQTLNGYLMGHLAREPGDVGPFQKREGEDDHWQLDLHNDYFLRFDIDDDGNAVFGSVFTEEDIKLDTAFALFQEAYLKVYA